MSRIRKEMTLREVIGRNVKLLLIAQGISTKDIAKRMSYTPNAVNKWLRGETDMGIDNLGRIAQILHTTPMRLMSPPEEVAENCMKFMEVV